MQKLSLPLVRSITISICPHKSFIFKDKDGRKTADSYLRVRVEGKEGSVALKHYHRKLEGVARPYLDEIETALVYPQKLLKIFSKLGFRKIAVIDKTRTSFCHQNF